MNELMGHQSEVTSSETQNVRKMNEKCHKHILNKCLKHFRTINVMDKIMKSGFGNESC